MKLDTIGDMTQGDLRRFIVNLLLSDPGALPKKSASVSTSRSPLVAKGDIYTHDANVDNRLAVGADGSVLTADATQPTGLKYATGPAPGPHHATHEPGGTDPMAVDAAAATGSLRTLGTGATQAAPGQHGSTSHDGTVPSLPAPLAAAEVVFASGVSTLSGDPLFSWDSGNRRLGIGIAAPANKLHIVGGATVVEGADGANNNNTYRSYGSSIFSAFNQRAGDGTRAAPRRVQSGRVVFRMGAGSMHAVDDVTDAVDPGSNRAYWEWRTSEVQTPTAQGHTIHLFSVGLGSTIAVERLGLDSSGYLTLGVVSSGPKLIQGTGSPEGAVVAPIGSVFFRTDGAAGTAFYLKETGAGNTGWSAGISASDVRLTDPSTPYDPGTVTIATERFLIQSGQLKLVGSEQFAIQGTTELVLTDMPGHLENLRGVPRNVREPIVVLDGYDYMLYNQLSLSNSGQLELRGTARMILSDDMSTPGQLTLAGSL